MEQVSDELEKAMFKLSEQVEGGIGSVPKLFYNAQTKATQEWKPIGALKDSEVINDEDVEVLETTLSSSSLSCDGASKAQCSEVINID